LPFLGSKYAEKLLLRRRLSPGPTGGTYSAPPDPVAGFQATLRRGRREEWREGKWMGRYWNRRRYGKGWGKVATLPLFPKFLNPPQTPDNIDDCAVH